jgi:hypothetical protein
VGVAISSVGGIISCVGETVTVPVGGAVGVNVTEGIVVPVGVAEGVAVAGAQAARNASRLQINMMRNCIPKLYP